MRLLYCYSEFYDNKGNRTSLRGLSKIELNLSTNQVFEYRSMDNSLSMREREKPLSDDFWQNGSPESNIYNVSAIAGKNGAGKTTLINYLIDLLSFVFSGFHEIDMGNAETSEDYYCIIETYLLKLVETINDELSANGSYSRMNTELFLRDFLNILFGWNLSVINNNSIPGVDLIDQNNRIAVQISVTNTRSKIQRSIDIFSSQIENGNLMEPPWHYIFIALTRKIPLFRKEFSVPVGLNFSKYDILDISELMERVLEVNNITLKRLSKLVEAYGFDIQDAEKELITSDSFSVQDHRNILVFESDNGGNNQLYIVDLKPQREKKDQHLLLTNDFSDATVVIGNNNNNFSDDKSQSFFSEFRKIKVVYLTNTLNQRDIRRNTEADSQNNRDSFVYNCSLGADMARGFLSHYENEKAILERFMFDDEQKDLINSITELTLPSTMTVWFQNALLLGVDYYPLLVAACCRVEVLDPDPSTLLPADLLCSLCAASFIRAFSQSFGINITRLLSGVNEAYASQLDSRSLFLFWDIGLTNIIKQAFGFFSVLSENYIISGISNGVIAIGNAEKNEWERVLTGHSAQVCCITIMPKSRMVTGSKDSTLRVWNLSSGECLQILEGHKKSINSVVALSGERVISGSDDGTLRVWNIDTGRCSRIFNEHKDSIACVTALQNGNAISYSVDGILKVWNPATGKCLQSWHSKNVTCIASFSDGKIISGSYDGTLRVWNSATGKCLKVLRGHTNRISCIAVLDNMQVISSSDDCTIRIWDAKSGKCIKMMGEQVPLVSCRVNSDGQIIGVGLDKTIRTINIDTGECLNIIPPYSFDFGNRINRKCKEHLDFVCKNEELINKLHRAGANNEGVEIPLDKKALKVKEKDSSFAWEFYEKYLAISDVLPTMQFSWGLSSGEENMLRIFAMLANAFERNSDGKKRKVLFNRDEKDEKKPIPCDSVILLMDEADLTLHPEWQRRLIDILTTGIPKVFPKESIKDLHILLSTHSPLLLGDIPGENVHYLGKDNVLIDTFGQNIHTILKDSFFLDRGTIGEFAVKKIDKLAKQLKQFAEDNEMSSGNETLSEVRKTIELVAPGLIRAKLEALLMEAERKIMPGEVSQQVRAFWNTHESLSNADRQFLLQMLTQGRNES